LFVRWPASSSRLSVDPLLSILLPIDPLFDHPTSTFEDQV
jgi:hypothetical protein